MSFLWTLLVNSWLARCTAAILAGFIAVKAYGYHEKMKGRAEVVQESKVEGKKLNAASEKARNRVTDDDKYFAERLRKWCRDCK